MRAARRTQCARPSQCTTIRPPCIRLSRPAPLTLPRRPLSSYLHERCYSTSSSPPHNQNPNKTSDPLRRFDLLADFGDSPKVKIDGYNDTGFLLATRDGEKHVHGSIILYPNFALHWTPKTFSDITIESLTALWLTHPPMEIVIIGTGKTMQMLQPELLAKLHEQKLRYEVLSSRNACSAFNVLNAEDRRVIACMLPANSD